MDAKKLAEQYYEENLVNIFSVNQKEEVIEYLRDFAKNYVSTNK